jgi:prepilin-type N-terminal cleavage/methylation domain-containing protein
MTASLKSTNKSSRRAAFSLMELLVVITIILILFSMIYPVVHRVQAQALGANCFSNLRQIGMIVTTYTRRNKGYLPHEDNGDTRPPKGCGWSKVLPRRRDVPDLFRCPSVDDLEAKSYKMNSLLETEKMPFVLLNRLRPRNLVLFFDGRVDNKGVRRMPKGKWGMASNRHPDGTHFVNIMGEVHSYDSDTGEEKWEGPGDISWEPKKR